MMRTSFGGRIATGVGSCVAPPPSDMMLVPQLYSSGIPLLVIVAANRFIVDRGLFL
jgi:hypothetical protein